MKQWLRTVLHHPTLGGGIILIIAGLIESVLSGGTLWRPAVIGLGTFLFLVILNRRLRASDEQHNPSGEAVDSNGDKGPPRAPQSSQSVSQVVHKKSPTKEGRVFSPRTAQELALFMKDRTTTEIETFNEHYGGKWLSVEGEINHVSSPSLGLIGVSLNLPHPDPECSLPLSVIGLFDSTKWLDELVTYSSGNSARVTGKIREVGYYNMSLKDCEIEHLESPGDPRAFCE